MGYASTVRMWGLFVYTYDYHCWEYLIAVSDSHLTLRDYASNKIEHPNVHDFYDYPILTEEEAKKYKSEAPHFVIKEVKVI